MEEVYFYSFFGLVFVLLLGIVVYIRNKRLNEESKKRAEIAKLLIAAKADLNLVNNDGKSAYMMGLEAEHKETLDFF